MFLAGQPLGPLQQALESKSGVSLYKKILCTYQKFSTDYGLSLWGTVSLWRSILKEKGQKENNIFKEIFLHLYIKTPNTLSSSPYPASPILGVSPTPHSIWIPHQAILPSSPEKHNEWGQLPNICHVAHSVCSKAT